MKQCIKVILCFLMICIMALFVNHKINATAITQQRRNSVHTRTPKEVKAYRKYRKRTVYTLVFISGAAIIIISRDRKKKK